MTHDEVDQILGEYYARQLEQAPRFYGTQECPEAWRFVDAKVHPWTLAELAHFETGCPYCARTKEMLANMGPSHSHVSSPERTEECPPLVRFSEAVGGGWSAEERTHVTGCSYCQTQVAKQWLSTPPKLLDLAYYLAERSLDDEAMNIYLSWMDSAPTRRLLQKSLYVRALAELVRRTAAIKETSVEMGAALKAVLTLADDLEGMMGLSFASSRGASRGAGAGESLVDVAGARIRNLANGASVASASVEEGSLPNRMSGSTPDHAVTVEVLQMSSDSLKIRATAAIENSGRQVLVELLPEGDDPLQERLDLDEQKAVNQAAAEKVVDVSDAARLLRNCSLLVAWIS